MKLYSFAALAACFAVPYILSDDDGCGCQPTPSSDHVQQQQQESILAQGTASVGMPAIVNFRERKILKDIYELRDQDNLVTYTYLFSDYSGRLRYLGVTVGFPIPYSTQFSNPQKVEQVPGDSIYNAGRYVLPQADPNTLFSPADAEATWVLLKNPKGNDVQPFYCEPRVVCSPFKLPATIADYPPGEAP